MPQFSREIEMLERAVIAGAVAMEQLVQDGVAVKTERKADASLVMNLDLASQAAMLQALKSDTPVVSEEDPASHRLIEKQGSFFLCDPLDGTSSCRRCLMHHGRFFPGNVGFGPLGGFAQNGILVAAVFLNLPDRALFSAVRGQGAFISQVGADNLPAAQSKRTRLAVPQSASLRDASLLFYPGKRGEMEFGMFLRKNDIVESLYRFGGFASDCTRIARGYEQGEIQFSLKAWDLPGALIAEEAGCDVIMDPFGEAVSLDSWRLAAVNPALIVAPGLLHEMRTTCAAYKDAVAGSPITGQ